jgi:hypothetical protein
MKVGYTMKIRDIITERRGGAMQYLKQLLPSTPDYVLQDFVYKHYKNDLKNIEPDIIEWLNTLQWQKKNVNITMEVFDDFTQNRLKQLVGDTSQTQDPRYATQQDIVKKTGSVSGEPIILTVDDGKYELQEGWHRTVAGFKAYPDGFTIPAYIGT